MSAHVTGGCLCGAVRWHATGPPRISTLCHCEACRRAAGAPAVAWLTFAADACAFEGAPRRYRTPTRAWRPFCAPCGSPLTYRSDGRADEIDVTTGSADDPEAFPPAKDVFPEDRLSWVHPVTPGPE